MEDTGKMKLRKYIVFMLLFLLCGCGLETEKDEKQTQEISNQETTYLTLAHCWTQQEAITRIVAEYNNCHDNIQINVEYIPVEQYVTTLKNRSTAGELPDIYMGWPGSSMEWFYQNKLAEDLSSEEWVERLDVTTREDATYEGSVRMLPLNKTFICIGYNKELFKQLGCDLPNNYDEFLQNCEKLKENGILPIALGSRDSSGYIYPSWMMAVSEIYAFDPEYNEKLYAGTEMMGEKWESILSRQYDWIQKGYVDTNHLAIDRMSDSLDLFIKEKAGMFILGSWELDNIMERMAAENSTVEMGFFPMPSSIDQGILLLASGEGLCVSATSVKSEQALDVLRYFAEKEPNQLFQSAMNSFSTLDDLELEYNAILDEINIYVDERTTWGYPDASWPRIIGDKYSELFPKYLAGKITAKEFMEQMENLWDKSVQGSETQ